MKTISLLLLLFSCSFFKQETFHLETAWGKKIPLRLAIEEEVQRKGLSGIPDSQFSTEEGMLFVYNEMAPRRFWMPDTYFDLDIIFLSEDLTIIQIERDVPHHPGKEEPPPIATTKTVMAYHILEMRSNSKVSKELKIGDKFIWRGPSPLPEIALRTHQQK